MIRSNSQTSQAMVPQMVDRGTCPDCDRRSDWDFLKDFYRRHDVATREIQTLRGHVSQLNNALHHAGQTSQKDRIALNNSHSQAKELEAGFKESETARAGLQEALHNERQDHVVCDEKYKHEYIRHRETERTLESVWASHAKLREVLSQTHCYTDDGAEGNYNVTELVCEVAAKSQRIEELNSQLEREKQEYDFHLNDFIAHFDKVCEAYVDDHVSQCRYTEELKARLQQVWESQRTDEHGLGPAQGPRPQKRTRRRTVAQGNKGMKAEDVSDEAGSSKQVEARNTNMLPIIKEEA